MPKFIVTYTISPVDYMGNGRSLQDHEETVEAENEEEAGEILLDEGAGEYYSEDEPNEIVSVRPA